MAPTSTKRPLDEADDAVNAKRGKGRTPQDPNAPKQGRGRPPKDPSERVTPKKPKVPGRGRGRPRKDPSERVTPIKPKVPGRGRGRPRKDAKASENEREERDDLAASPGILKLSKLIGTYEINCEEVDENWPDSTEEMTISISAIPHIKACLIASFNLGILEGTMLLSADKKTVERVCGELDINEEKTTPKEDKSVEPTVKNGTLYYTWRGRDINVPEHVYLGRDGLQTGILKFIPPEFTSFQGLGSFPDLHDPLEFTGTKTDDDPEETPEPWTAFSAGPSED